MGSFSTKPIYVFGGAGLMLFGLSMFSGGAVIVMKFTHNLSMNRNPLLILTVLLILMSFMFIMLGILAEILIRIYHESQDKSPYTVKSLVNIGKKR